MQFLVDIIPTKARRYVYGVVALAAFAYAVWQAAEGDWRTTAGSLLSSMVAALAHANTNGSEPPASS